MVKRLLAFFLVIAALLGAASAPEAFAMQDCSNVSITAATSPACDHSPAEHADAACHDCHLGHCLFTLNQSLQSFVSGSSSSKQGAADVLFSSGPLNGQLRPPIC